MRKSVAIKKNIWCGPAALLLSAALFSGAAPGGAQIAPAGPSKITPEMRRAAALRRASAPGRSGGFAVPLRAPVPGGTPDYFNYPNYANSPLPTVVGGVATGGGIRKFVNTLPGLGAGNPNNLGQYIPVAVKDTGAYPGSDYYELGLVDFNQKMHTDLPATKLRGYKDLAPGADGAAHYLGPMIIARKDRPVRIKFTNQLTPGGSLFLPVDTTVMGAGMGPDGMTLYSQNRATIHLHGSDAPWISDGTPHQWVAPVGDPTPYKKGDSQKNVPDMAAPGEGSMTFFYPNQLSARLMFYHDHAFGLTRLNVYAGEAAGYLLTDPVEENLITTGVLPDAGGDHRYGIPLIIQDKTFVDSTTIAAQDPTWNWGSTPGTARTGDLWFPHVYMPAQNPDDAYGVNAMGRWDYGPWTWPPSTPEHGPEAGGNPGVPHPSVTPESFMDTPVVNGTAYPTLTVQRKPYRFRILNACNDRFLNLQLYSAAPGGTEVAMVPAVFNPAYPATWPTDGRAGGVPDPAAAGPAMIQIGTEGGFLPAPVVLPNTPLSGDLLSHTLLLAPAERGDVIIDFSAVPLGVTQLILYNDAMAPAPGGDPRYDYYTGNPDQTAEGGAPATVAGYGPNTRTIMRFDLTGGILPGFNLAGLQAALPAAYAASQAEPIVPQAAYNAPFGAAYTDKFAKITDKSVSFTTAGLPVTLPIERKSLSAGFEPGYGRLTAMEGVADEQTVIGLGFSDPATEILRHGESQLWRITNTDEDIHSIHFHLFNVQVVNRVGFGGQVTPPDGNELGWKETVRANPMEDTIVALRPVASTVPFAVPDSVRLLKPDMAEGATWTSLDPESGEPVTITNELTNFGWEYTWHCHILGHEENDMMRPIIFRKGPLGTKKLRACAPNRAVEGSNDVTVSLEGEDLDPGSTVRLTRAGYPAVEASSVSVVSSTRLTATFKQPFSAGRWNIAVSGGGETLTLPNAFTLLAPVPNAAKVYQGVFKPRQGEAAQFATSLPAGGEVKIRVFDAIGRRVRDIFKGARAAGNYVDTWDGKNDGGNMCASGAYLVRFECPGFNVTKRVVLVK